MRWAAVIPIACVVACTHDLSTDNFGHPFELWVPSDVRAFVIDSQGCTHFSGESGEGMPERQAYIDKMMRKSCNNLDERKRLLMERHKSPQIRQAISDAWD